MSDADRPEFHCFVEKRSRNGREYRFNRAKSDKPCDASSRLLPRLIATHRDRFGFTTYVQYVPLRLAAFLEDHGAEHLADVVFRIAEIEPVAAVHKMQPKNRFTPATLDALLNCAENGGAMANDRARASIETVRSLWDRAASVVPAGPLVLAHGDLHLDNLRTLGEPNGKRTLKILDWEKVGMNYVGADLDFVARGHLARAGLSATPFLDRYFARAKEAFGISPPSLQLAAHLTASANCIKRTLDSGRFDNLNTAARLLVRAQRYMAVIGACLLSLPSAAGFPAGS